MLHCRSLQLPDGSRPKRPQPRQPPSHAVTLHTPHTSHPHSDAQPRQPLVPVPHPPDHDLQQDSYTFLTSTCCEPSQINESDPSRNTYIMTDIPQQEASLSEDRPSPHFQPRPLLLTHTNSTSSGSYATSTDGEIVTPSPVNSLSRDVSPALPPSLTDPAVQRELVLTRDTLKHFHQLKTRKR